MSGLRDLLGEEFVDANGKKFGPSRLAGRTAIGLLFGASWSMASRAFASALMELYHQTVSEHPFEVVYISSDHNQEEFDGFVAEMPWLAVPFADRQLKVRLSEKYVLPGIPSLVIVNGQGETINERGREAIAFSPTPDGFPWPAPTLKSIIGDTFVRANGKKATAKDLEGKVLGVYFSAPSWCGPCKAFTPNLIAAYSAARALGRKFEVVFVSGDHDEAAFQASLSKMPWLAVPLADSIRITKLKAHYSVSGIPTLVIADVDGSTITDKGVAATGADPKALEFPWHPKPSVPMAEAGGFVNDVPCLVAFLEGCDDPTQDSAVKLMNEAAEQHRTNVKAGTVSARLAGLRFVYTLSEDNITTQVRKLLGLSVPENSPHLILLDFDDDCFYPSAPGEVTSDDIARVLRGYDRRTLEKKDLPPP